LNNCIKNSLGKTME